MPIEILRLQGYDGPNLYGPQPGVALHVRSESDCGRRLAVALKDAGQGAGLVIGYLDITSEYQAGSFVVGVRFATPAPALGVELARYVVAGLNAREARDEEWDAEGPLWEFQKRRRAAALPLHALQVAAEASARGIPAFVRRDGRMQLGTGARGRSFDLAAPGSPVSWEALGAVPILALAGGAERDPAARLIAVALQKRHQVALALAADFEATRDLLADPDAAIAVVGLTAEGIADRGLAFNRCAYSAVVDLPATLPPQIADREELARVLGVPMLVTDPAGRVVLNADVLEIAALAEYAPCPAILVSEQADNPIVARHRASGGTALFVRAGAVIAAQGPREQMVAMAAGQPGALAALALIEAMELPRPL